MSSIARAYGATPATLDTSRPILPPWVVGATERVMRYYVKRNLKLDPVTIDAMPAPIPGHRYMLYAHVPFCHTLCTYCTFHRFLFKEHKARDYFVSLRKEMDMVHALGYDFHSMYIGGGTTTVLEDELVRTIEHARKLFPSIREVSCETDPSHLATPAFRQLKGLVDRMSIGVQSFNDDILRMTDRLERFGNGAQTIERIRAAQELFPICNIDLIFGFRGQTDEILQQDLETTLSLAPRQITTYPLMVTRETRKSVKDSLAGPADAVARQYRIILDTLGAEYNQLSSWAFGQAFDEGFDEYVTDFDEYVGVGSGSFSFLKDTLYANTFSLRRYNERIAEGKMGVERRVQYSAHDILQYRFLMGLFSGRLSRKRFREVYGANLDRALFKEMLGMKAIGAIKENPADPEQPIVTEQGKLAGLLMMKEFYAGMDNVRAELRKPLKACDM